MNIKDRVYNILTQEDVLNCMSRFNEKVSWDNENNLGVNMLAAIESGYFNPNIHIDMFNGQRKIQTYYNGVLPANFG